MKPTISVQQQFFQHLKALLPPHLAMVDEVAVLLNLSTDSAYRRIRGEKPLVIDEMFILASHYKISLDHFLKLDNDSFLFTGKLANATDHTFEKWMESLLQQIQFINSFRQKHLYYLAKDIPLMQQFFVPELTAFKSFFWRKSILHYDTLKGVKFSLKNIEPAHVQIAEKIQDVYSQIPATDIWNIESINSTIRQIEFYREANAFDSTDDVHKLYAAVLKLLNHIEKQAEVGLKFKVDGVPQNLAASFSFFNNEVILGDNTVLAVLDDLKVTFLNHSVINFVGTRDEGFNAHMYDTIQNLIRKSTQLSSVGEKERTKFFNRMRDKVRAAARF